MYAGAEQDWDLEESLLGVSAVEKSTLDGVINKNFLLLFFGGWKSKAMVIEDLVGPIVFKKFLL